MYNETMEAKDYSLSLTEWLKKEFEETALILRSVPALAVSLFVVSVVCMNLLANKTIVQTDWIALDGGILISWLSFMCMDIITNYFGPKASNKIAVVAVVVSLLVCFVFYIVSVIPSSADDYTALNSLLGGTWFILLGSTIAFLLSAAVNNFLNWTIGKAFRKNPDGRLAYAVRAYVSTFAGQFIDNFIFAVIVFVIFAPIFWDGFHWTLIQCAMCALTGAVAEAVMEILFSPIGYRVLKSWRENSVGREYLEHIKKER